MVIQAIVVAFNHHKPHSKVIQNLIWWPHVMSQKRDTLWIAAV